MSPGSPAAGPGGGTGTGVGLVLVAVVSVQLGAGLATQLFPVVGPGGAVWLRLVLAAVLMAVIWPSSRLPRGFWWPPAPAALWPRWWAGRDPRRSDRRRNEGSSQALGWSREAWIAVSAFGAGLALMNWAFYESIARIPLGVAVALEFTGPLTLALVLSRRRADAVWALGAATGIAALTLDPATLGELAGGLDPAGVLLAVVAGAFWTAYILLSGRVGRLVPGTRGLSAALVVGAVLLAPVGLSAGSGLVDPRVLALGLGVAILSTALAYGLELEALRRLPARLFGILMSVEPVVAALVGWLVLSQVLRPLQWVGVLVVSAVSVGATLTVARRGERA